MSLFLFAILHQIPGLCGRVVIALSLGSEGSDFNSEKL